MPYFDPTYLVLVPSLLLSLWASWRVNHTFDKYNKTTTRSGITAAQAAREVLDDNGLYHVEIQRVSGKLTDHFDPKNNVIRLSDSVYSSTSTAAIGVACHEAGHAVQHAQNYKPAEIRQAIVSVTNIGSQAGMWLFLVGLLLSYLSEWMFFVCYLGIALFSMTAIFQLVTLPTEYDASRRAMEALTRSRRFTDEELSQSKKVLSAAALTYVAALAVSLSQVLRLLLVVGRRRGRR